MTDAATKGRMVHGEGHPGHVLSSADVQLVRDARASGVMGKDIAKAFGVSETLVSNIVNWKLRRHG